MKQRTSVVWNIFSIIDKKNETAECNICKTHMSYKSSVSNLKKHITRKHPTVQLFHKNVQETQESDKGNEDIEPAESSTAAQPQIDLEKLEPVASTSKSHQESKIPNPAPKIQTKISSYVPKKMTVVSKKKIDDALLMMFYKDFQPFRIVEDEGFRRYTKALNPSYELPTRQIISKTAIPALYEKCLFNCREKVKNILAVSLTTDCWTSGNNESFMGITIHFIDEDFKLQTMLLKCAVFNKSHTSANLAEELKLVSEDWGVDKKIVLVVSDNAANVTNAIKTGLGWKFFGCYTHTLNLIVRDALQEPSVSEIIDKVKIIVSHFKKSSKATAKLMGFQENAGVTSSKKLIQDVVTRWNSTYYMIERFVELEEPLRSTIALLDIVLPQLTFDEWRLLKDLKNILEPFEDATRVMSGQQYLVSSSVIVITGGLLDVCQEILKTDLTRTATAVVRKLQHGLRNRLGNLEYSNTLAATTFLDPRYKTLPFKNSDAVERARKNCIMDLAEIISNKERVPDDQEKNKPSKTQDEEPKEKRAKYSIWTTIDKLALEEGVKTPIKSSSARAIVEVQRYMEEDILGRKKDPLEWWKDHQYIYPNLSLLARKKLCAVATSVPCESLFSKAGELLNNRRRRLKSNCLQKLLFLNYNSRFCR